MVLAGRVAGGQGLNSALGGLAGGAGGGRGGGRRAVVESRRIVLYDVISRRHSTSVGDDDARRRAHAGEGYMYSTAESSLHCRSTLAP